MQVTETLNEGLKRGYQIIVTAQELADKVNAKLLEAQPNVEIKGFRKGKVPMAMMKKQFGPSVLGEAMQESVDGAMNEHFEKTGDRPSGQPDVKMTKDDWKEGDDVEVALAYECLPTIPETDFSKLKLEKLVVKVDDADVEEALRNLAKTAQNFEDKKDGAKAEDGDQVVINFLGKVDDVAFDGGQGDDYPLVLGSNSFIPGFEAQLVGAKAGDDIEVKVTFPEEYGSKDLAGKDAVFECKVTAVKGAVAAEINDEMAVKFGAENLEGLKGQVSERLGSEYVGAARMVLKKGLMDQLDALVDFELPPTLLETEANQIAHQLWHEEHPEVEGHDHPEIETTEEHTKLATRRVRLGLLLSEVGSVKEINITDAEMQQAVMQQASQYPGQERQFFEFIQKNEQALQQLRAPLFEDKVIDHIVEQATVTEKEISKDDLQKAVEALEA
ncbi:MAG: trigger factor [Rhodobacteraceae bacterium]|nr:MAG: trigger factor [Paracoccaceae bacterium]